MASGSATRIHWYVAACPIYGDSLLIPHKKILCSDGRPPSHTHLCVMIWMIPRFRWDSGVVGVPGSHKCYLPCNWSTGRSTV